MKVNKHIKAFKKHILRLKRKGIRHARFVVSRSRVSRVARKYSKMEAKDAINRAYRYIRGQIVIRPRLVLAFKVVLVLLVVLAASIQISKALSDKKGKIKVQGQAILIAEASEPIDETVEISSNVSSKLSPFAYVNPVEDAMISQGFTSYHRALDMATSLGSLIKPIGNGVVEYAGFSADGKGNIVVVDHGDGLKTLYAHMGKIEVGIGNYVNVGTTLGTVGLTGRTTGAHLHLEAYDRGVAMNPVSILP